MRVLLQGDSTRDTCIVMDAIDECLAEASSKLPELVNSLVQIPGVKVLCTSQRQCLAGSESTIIELQNNNGSDIKEFIKNKVCQLKIP